MDMTTNVTFTVSRPQIPARQSLQTLRKCQALQTVAAANDNEVLLRSAMVFLGVVLCLAAFGLWLVPDAVANAESRVIRAALACVFIGSGFVLFRKGRDRAPVVGYALDQTRNELCKILIDADGSERITARLNLMGATQIPQDNGDVLICDAEGQCQMRLAAAQAVALFDHPLAAA